MTQAAAPKRAVFDGDLSTPEPIPEDAIRRAVELMRGGNLHRYGEDRSGAGEVALFEQEFADYIGLPYAVGVNSCGCALYVALKAVGVGRGDKVLMNAFTLAPAPGSVAHAGAEPVLVEIGRDLTIDLADLDAKAVASGARYLLLSHMRGHIADMGAVMEVCGRHGLTVVEDCAHTMGAGWDGTATGRFGAAACFSTQTFKHMNSGEGGIIVTADPDVAARAILTSGSYMLYGQHRARPDLEVFERHKYVTPNCSMRMTNLAAALLRPQLAALNARCARWNANYRGLAEGLAGIPRLRLINRDPREQFVGSSIQFFLEGLSEEQIGRFLADCDAHGVHVKWFGRAEPKGFTSRHTTWRYVADQAPLPRTDAVLDGLFDMRVPIGLGATQQAVVAQVVRQAMAAVLEGAETSAA